MPLDIKKVDYYNITVRDHAMDGLRLLSALAGAGVNLLAFKAAPLGPSDTRFTLFPNSSEKMIEGAEKAGLKLEGPYSALLILGDDASGALADIYEKLARAGVTIDESNGIAGIKGSYGVVLYLGQENCDIATAVLGI